MDQVRHWPWRARQIGRIGTKARRGQVLKLLVVVVAGAVLTVPATIEAISTPSFSDGFESGGFSAWTSVLKGVDGTATVQSVVVKTGNYAARLSATTAAGSFAAVKRSLPPLDELTAQGNFQITAEGASRSNVPIFRLFSASGKRLVSLYRQNQDSDRIWVQHSSAYNATSGRLPLNRWAHFELRVANASTSAGTVEVRLEGALVYQTTSTNLGDKIAAVQLGQEVKSQAFAIVADDITVTDGSGSTPPDTAAELANLKLLNYYPSDHGWGSMWTRWDPDGLARDFAAVRGLGANTVRLIVQPSAFGYPDPSPDMVARLQEAVSLADGAHLRVWISLFDLWSDYGDTASSDRWLDGVVSPFFADPRVAAFELRNEIPPDAVALAWARRGLERLRLVGARPTTISAAGGIDGLAALHHELADSPPSFYSVHPYMNGHGEAAYAFLKRARTTVAVPGPSGSVPGLFVGEFGRTSRPMPSQTASGAEADQDMFFREVFAAAAELGLPVPAPWILSDFTPGAIPSNLSAARNPDEYQMGLYRLDGTLKPAGQTVRRFFTQKTVTCDFNEGFEAGSGSSPYLWRTFSADQASFAWDSGVPHAGSASVRISSSTGTASAVPAWYIAPPCGPLKLGNEVHATVWARGQNATGLQRIAVGFFGGDGAYLGQRESLPAPNGTFDWKILSVKAPAPAGSAYVQIHLKSSANTGTVWFDDIVFDG